jgi:hypothetical protein
MYLTATHSSLAAGQGGEIQSSNRETEQREETWDA